MTDDLVPPPNRARLLASAGDLAVIVGWIGVLTVVARVVRLVVRAEPGKPSPEQLPRIDLAVFAATVLPAGAYLAVSEARAAQGTWGKRRQGLRVVTADGGRPGIGRTVLRAAVKLLPWQLAHIAVARMIVDADEPVTTWTTYALSLLLPAASVTAALRDPGRRGLHDRVAGTRVVA